MEQTTLTAARREALGSSNCGRLRRSGKVPGIVYGHKLDTLPVAVGLEELDRAMGTGARMLNLDIDGSTESVLVRDVQYDAFGDRILHVDFSRVNPDEEIHLDVDIEFHGEPVGLSEGGKLDLGIHQINIACLPARIPRSIRAELSGLDIGDTLHLKDLIAPEGIRFLTPAEVVVAHVRAPVAEAKPEEEGAEAGEGEAAEGAEKSPAEGESES